MNKSRIFLLTIFCGLLLSPNVASYAKTPPKEKPLAGSSLDIVAIVGEQAISSFDLESRIKFILATTRISNTPEVIANIKPQVIRTLIDESLQLEEATKNNIKIEDGEITQAIAGIEAQRGMAPGSIANMLTVNKVPLKTYHDQIRSQLAWGKLLNKSVRSRIKISDADINMAQGHIVTETKKETPVSIKEVEIGVITFPVDKPSRIAEMTKLSDRLYGELRKGAKFEEVARQFSAGGDGKPFWISPGQLEPVVGQVLSTTKVGSITPPIRTHDGFTIIKLVNVKLNPAPKEAAKAEKSDVVDFEISLKEILLKLKPTATEKEADVLLQISEAVSKNPGNCEEKGVAGMEDLTDFDIEVNMRKAPLSDLPPALKTLTENLKIGDMSTPFASAEGIRMYMLCGKKELGKNSSYARDKIRETLFRQKFELEAQKYLRNLRRETYIDVRG